MIQKINFKIVYVLNPDIYQMGYIEFDDECEDSEVEWYYFDEQGFVIPREFTHHDGVGVSITEEQSHEVDRFLELIHVELVDWVEGVICLSDVDENSTTQQDDLIIIINDGDDNGSDSK